MLTMGLHISDFQLTILSTYSTQSYKVDTTSYINTKSVIYKYSISVCMYITNGSFV